MKNKRKKYCLEWVNFTCLTGLDESPRVGFVLTGPPARGRRQPRQGGVRHQPLPRHHRQARVVHVSEHAWILRRARRRTSAQIVATPRVCDLIFFLVILVECVFCLVFAFDSERFLMHPCSLFLYRKNHHADFKAGLGNRAKDIVLISRTHLQEPILAVFAAGNINTENVSVSLSLSLPVSLSLFLSLSFSLSLSLCFGRADGKAS